MAEEPVKKDDEKVECVGSLLVHQTDLKELTEATHEGSQTKDSGSTEAPEKKKEEESIPSLVRRVTEKLKQPLTDEELEVMEEWQAFD